MTHKLADWQQSLWDLMANERIRLVVMGEVGDVVVTLEIWHEGKFVQVRETAGEDAEKSIAVVLDRWQELVND